VLYVYMWGRCESCQSVLGMKAWRGMSKFKSVSRVVSAWTAVVLSLYTVFVILNTLFLVPYDSVVFTPSQFIKFKAEIIAGSVVVLIALIVFARWAFRRPNGYRNSN
jgi:hypothetical protein